MIFIRIIEHGRMRVAVFNIHVGDEDQGFKDQVVKSLAATLCAFEGLLDKLHPKFRYNGDACQSLHRNAVLGEKEKAEANGDGTFDFLTEAERVGLLLWPEISRTEAIDPINNPFPETGHVYDLKNLVIPYVQPFKRTIEFRQHEMTFELNRVEHWIKVCVGIVQFAKDTEPSSLKDLLVNFVNDGMYTVERLLGEIGLPKEALFTPTISFNGRGMNQKMRTRRDLMTISIRLSHAIVQLNLTNFLWKMSVFLDILAMVLN